MTTPVHFTFAWPDPLTLDVTRSSSRRARRGGPEESSSHTARYRLRATRQGADTVVRAQWLDDPRAVILGARIPDVVLSPAGDVTRVLNGDAIRALMANIAPPDTDEGRALAPLVTDEALVAASEQEWRALIARWHGLSIAPGATIESVSTDDIEGEQLETTTALTLLAWDAARGVARLQASVRPRAAQALALQQRFLRRLAGGLEGGPRVDVREMKVITTVEIETTRALVPLRCTVVQKSATVLEVTQGGASETVTTSDESRDESVFAFAE